MVILLVIQQRIVGAKSQYVPVTAGLHQATQARVGDVLQHSPHDLVSHSSNIETNSLVHFPGLQDDVRLRNLVRNGLFVRRPTGRLIWK